jgi:hypothetical protein
MQLIRWHDTATDESTECTNGAFVIASSAVTTLFRIGISIYDHSKATLSEKSWVPEWELSEACFLSRKGSFHLLLLIPIVPVTTRRDLVMATERGPCLVRAVHSL